MRRGEGSWEEGAGGAEGQADAGEMPVAAEPREGRPGRARDKGKDRRSAIGNTSKRRPCTCHKREAPCRENQRTPG